MRAEAAAALGEIGDRRHYGALKSRLGAWLFVDARVYAALGALGGAEEVDVLLALTKTQNWSEQYYGMKGLARTRLSEAADRLAEVWLDGESQFQSHAAECLLEMGAVGVRRAGKALASDDPKVRAKAVQLLGRSRHPEARSALRVALEDPDERVRKLAKRALGKPRAHGRPKDAPARR